MEKSNSALASLTATYTDSEGEPEDRDYDEEQEGSESSVRLKILQLHFACMIFYLIIFQAPKPQSDDSRENQSAQPSPIHLISTHNSPSQSPSMSQKKALRLVSYNENDDDDPTSPNRDITIMDVDNEKIPDRQLNKNAEEEKQTIEPSLNSIDYSKIYGFTLPPEPKGKCSVELQDKISKSYEKMRTTNMDMNKIIQGRKEFRNPSIYEKLISFCDINELGTNYPPEIYDPSHFGNESYYEELARIQKIEMDKLEKTKKEQTTIVVTGSKKPIDIEALKRKSKWDQPAPNVQVKPVTTVTGTKTTIISAFGSLPKKPKV